MKKITILALLTSMVPVLIVCMDNKESTKSTLPEGFVPVKTIEIDGNIILLDAKRAQDLANLAAAHEEINRRRVQRPVGAKLQLKAPVAPPSKLTEVIEEVKAIKNAPESDTK